VSPVYESKGIELLESDEDDSEFVEKDPNEEESLNVRNLGTLLENVTSAMDVRNRIFCAAPGKGNRPLGLYQDEFAEDVVPSYVEVIPCRMQSCCMTHHENEIDTLMHIMQKMNFIFTGLKRNVRIEGMYWKSSRC
jgi:hypothetical protein